LQIFPEVDVAQIDETKKVEKDLTRREEELRKREEEFAKRMEEFRLREDEAKGNKTFMRTPAVRLVKVQNVKNKNKITTFGHGEVQFDKDGFAFVPVADAVSLCQIPNSPYVLVEEDEELKEEIKQGREAAIKRRAAKMKARNQLNEEVREIVKVVKTGPMDPSDRGTVRLQPDPVT